jgi:hypothetical protein
MSHSNTTAEGGGEARSSAKEPPLLLARSTSMVQLGRTMSKAVLWEAGGKYVPVVFHASFYYNHADLFIVEKILIDNGDDGYKRIRLIGRKVSFSNDGAIDRETAKRRL